jgi:ABC-type multidrug transport system fused ATPase/permease subunit
VNVIRALAAKKGVDVQLPLSKCKKTIHEARTEETVLSWERVRPKYTTIFWFVILLNVIIWVLSSLPFVIFLVVIFLLVGLLGLSIYMSVELRTAIKRRLTEIFPEAYVDYRLMKDFYKHERREDHFWENVDKALNTCGIREPLPRRTKILPDRSFALYLMLSIVTLGMFSIYWDYVLINDPNEHFKYHILAEDHLLHQLESVAI